MLNRLINRIKKSKHIFLILWVIIVLLGIVIFSTGNRIADEREEKNGVSLDMNSNGNENIYVKDGVTVSLQNIYHNVNYVALQIQVKNNTKKPVTISAKIKDLDKKLEFAAINDACEYIMMSDTLVSVYDIEIKIYQLETILASGTIHVTPDKINAKVFESEELLKLNKDMEVYYLGLDDSSQFFKIKNKTTEEKNVCFTGDTVSFNVNVENGSFQYIYVTEMDNISITMDAFDITMQEPIEEKEEVTTEEAMYPN